MSPDRPTSSTGGQRRKTARSVILIDRTARTGITLGGLGIIAAIIGILVFILFESLPLFLPGRVEPVARLSLGEHSPNAMAEPATPGPADHDAGQAIAVALDEYRELAWCLGPGPEFRLFDPRDGRSIDRLTVDSLSGTTPTTAHLSLDRDLLAIGTVDGRIVLGRPGFSAEWVDGRRSSHFVWSTLETIRLDPPVAVGRIAAWRGESRGMVAVTGRGDDRAGRLRVISEEISRSLLGGETVTRHIHDLGPLIPDEVTALALAGESGQLFAGTSRGHVYRFALPEGEAPRLEEVLAVDGGRAVTALTVLLGDATLIVGTSDGRVSSWFGVRDLAVGNALRPFRKIRDFPPSGATITALAPSSRTKSFAVADGEGRVRLMHHTTHRVLAGIESSGRAAVRTIAYAPKADGIAFLSEAGGFEHYSVDIPHPEVSLKALFGKVWYEGYTEPDHVWQSTGGSDEFESKLSLVPLIFGTLKGTVYALIFAVPIAILAAIYTSQFMADRVRQYVKPTVEIMAALPSVVLGFLAGLFLAPYLETMVPATFVFLVLLPVVPTVLGILWQLLPPRVRGGLPLGFELIAVIPIVALTFLLARWLGPGIEQTLFAGSFREWLMDASGTRYDQRNCIVVGFAMGFAVIPIIFTIVEDSLSAVPRSLIAGSMACGASRWQTAIHIILPAAGSGIFSAIMIGFGRAVGETMIVLMATGNTPIMDWSVFNGMRTLSANIAVEMPEAPYRGSLYRLLFFAGLLLLLMTSVINTAAELIRVRLKRKFGNY